MTCRLFCHGIMVILNRILLAVLPLILFSCGDTSLTRTLPNVTGTTGDVLIVTGMDVWQGSAGRSLRDDFAAPLAGLPQREPAFNLVQINPAGFRDLFLTDRDNDLGLVIVFTACRQYRQGGHETERNNEFISQGDGRHSKISPSLHTEKCLIYPFRTD